MFCEFELNNARTYPHFVRTLNLLIKSTFISHSFSFRIFDELTAQYKLKKEEMISFFNLFDTFIALAKKNGIQYFLHEGSLLGWYRCSDMLPWDDDIDLAMTKADARKVVDILKTMVCLI